MAPTAIARRGHQMMMGRGWVMRAFGICIDFWWRLLRRLFHREAKRLNLRLDTLMATIGVPVNFTIAPTNAEGAPASVNNIAWSLSTADVVTPTADGLAATTTPGVAGEVTVTVTAVSLGGKPLTASATFTVAAAVDAEAVALNLTVSGG